jgi:hypothetical protein
VKEKRKGKKKVIYLSSDKNVKLNFGKVAKNGYKPSPSLITSSHTTPSANHHTYLTPTSSPHLIPLYTTTLPTHCTQKN